MGDSLAEKSENELLESLPRPFQFASTAFQVESCWILSADPACPRGYVLILGGLTSCWEILLPHTSPTGLADPPLLPSFYLPTGRHSFSQFLVS